ncbi:mCG140074 [Mus musculus]|nr:mCG140074 [Mus musculus]
MKSLWSLIKYSCRIEPGPFPVCHDLVFPYCVCNDPVFRGHTEVLGIWIPTCFPLGEHCSLGRALFPWESTVPLGEHCSPAGGAA